ncbi:MAG: hypothetical protein KJ072_28075 [Verrucomicrobia bacterium]|nr:hypothetical protein [Verrucomicrobiota bacterium]
MPHFFNYRTDPGYDRHRIVLPLKLGVGEVHPPAVAVGDATVVPVEPLRQATVRTSLHFDMHQDPFLGAIEQKHPVKLVDPVLAGLGIAHHLLQFLVECGKAAGPVDPGVYDRETKPQERIEIAIEGLLPRTVEIGA